MTLDCGRVVGKRTPIDGGARSTEGAARARRGAQGATRRAMRLIHGYRDLDPQDRGAAAAIGNFDGVHRGHRVLIEDARKAASAAGAPLGVITFEPHPLSLIHI